MLPSFLITSVSWYWPFLCLSASRSLSGCCCNTISLFFPTGIRLLYTPPLPFAAWRLFFVVKQCMSSTALGSFKLFLPRAAVPNLSRHYTSAVHVRTQMSNAVRSDIQQSLTVELSSVMSNSVRTAQVMSDEFTASECSVCVLQGPNQYSNTSEGLWERTFSDNVPTWFSSSYVKTA